MGKPSWIRRLFGAKSPRRATSAPACSTHSDRPRPDQGTAPARAGESSADLTPPVAASGIGNIDRRQNLDAVLASPEQDVLFDIGQRIDQGRFELPQLPTSSVNVLAMTGRPDAEVAAVVNLISADPLLCSELLKTANSVLFAGQRPSTELHEAVMRIGLHSLRSLIFSVSMRSAILKGRGLNDYATEVWRQALSVATIARAIGPELGIESERAFVLGLLQDIGKIALLTLLRDEASSTGVTSALVGRVFHSFHERVGGEIARLWNLPAELRTVCGSHHTYAQGGEQARSAALAFLAHQLDLYQSLGDDQGFRRLASSPVMDFLELPEETRHRVLQRAREAYDTHGSQPESAVAA